MVGMKGRLVTITYSNVFPDDEYGDMTDRELIDFIYENIVGVDDGQEKVEPVED
jgi:hypothetical protein